MITERAFHPNIAKLLVNEIADKEIEDGSVNTNQNDDEEAHGGAFEKEPIKFKVGEIIFITTTKIHSFHSLLIMEISPGWLSLTSALPLPCTSNLLLQVQVHDQHNQHNQHNQSAQSTSRHPIDQALSQAISECICIARLVSASKGARPLAGGGEGGLAVLLSHFAMLSMYFMK